MSNTKQNPKGPGTLYGIGVGPGDPELIPLKSIRILHEVDVIFSASSTKNAHSLAVTIASRHLPENADVRLLPFPMTMNRKMVEQAWDEHSQTIIAVLEEGKDAAFLTLGDSLTYSTFGYLLRTIRRHAPHLPVVTIPGITSYQAAAAATNTPLVEGEENMLLLSGVLGGNGLRKKIKDVDNIVFLKAYKNIKDIVASLEETGRLKSSLAVVRCGFPEQKIYQNVSELVHNDPKYWTLILTKNSPGHED